MKYIYLFLLVSASLTPLFSQNTPSNLPAAGLVGWWPLDGDAVDRMGSGNNVKIFDVTPVFEDLVRHREHCYLMVLLIISLPS